MRKAVNDHLDPPSWECDIEENEMRMKARKRYEEEVMKELEYGSSIIETNDDFRCGTRLNYSRILESDEDNPDYGIF